MTGYSTLQQDQLKKIGADLQESREAQSKSIDDIAVQTYIRPQLLKAIETGNVDDLPQPIFVQGFIRRYAEALNLDGKTLAKQFPVHSIPNTPRPNPQPSGRSFGADAMANPVITARSRPASRPLPTAGTGAPLSAASPRSGGPSAASKSAPSAAPVVPAARLTADQSPVGDPPQNDAFLERKTYGEDGVVPPAKHPLERPINRPLPTQDRGLDSGGSPVPYVLAGVLAVGVVGAIALLFNLGGGNQAQQAAQVPELEPIPQIAEPVEPAPEPEPEPEPTSPSAASDAPVAVSVKLTGDSWMSVRVDGANVFEGLMTTGAEELYEGQERVYISTGNAGAVELSYNGSDPEVAGPGGAVREFTYTP
ncbi:MAG: RodZ domain-containing protein [Cyanobacteria bacterium P01_A01_bin.105]